MEAKAITSQQNPTDMSSKEGDSRKKRRLEIMGRELEYAKCIAVLRKIFRMGLISETEYMVARNKIMSKYLVLESSQEAA